MRGGFLDIPLSTMLHLRLGEHQPIRLNRVMLWWCH